MTFKEKLVILRKTRKITQDELASAVGVSRQAVYKWECGQSYPEVPKLLEIKFLFGISIDDLLDDSFDIALPEKKKRKRRAKTATPGAENAVVADTTTEEKPAVVVSAPKSEEKPLPKEDVVASPATKEEKVEEPVLVASAPSAVEKDPAKAVTEEVPEQEAAEKKKGFFGRLFGKK